VKLREAFHPYLFAIYAVIGVFQINANDIPPSQIIRPMLTLIAITAVVNYLGFIYFKNIHRAALITSLLIFWGLYFGHVYRFASNFQVFENIPGHRTIALVLWTIIIGSFALPGVWRAFKNPSLLTKSLNVTSAAVLIIPVVVLSLVVRETAIQKTIMEQSQSQLDIKISPGSSNDPDIYYIIVDAYGRQDTLSKYYDCDNSALVNYLDSKGFYVAKNSQSNYMMTHLSLASSLNFEYLNDLENHFENSANRGPYSYMIDHNSLRDYLSVKGYQFVNIESIAMFARLRDADIYLSPSSSPFNELELLLLTTSVADKFIETLFPEVPLLNYETHRRLLKFQFDALANSVDIEGKKFVFTHIWAPHPPFVFDENGNPIDSNRPYSGNDSNAFWGGNEEYISGYIGETTYINAQIRNTVNVILERSKTPPIIIIQGDHGPGLYTSFINVEETCFEDRFSILNAYYFPDGDYSDLSADITPVNSFRAVLNKYFDASLEQLENKYYYVTWLQPYQYVDVTGKTNQQCDIP